MPRGSVGLNSRIARLENIVQGLEPRVNTLFQQNENLLNNPWVPQGSWAASTNTPTLANGDAADAGSSYLSSDGGTVDFGAGGITFAGGDLVSKNAAGVWFKSSGIGSVLAGVATVADARTTLDVMQAGDVEDRQLNKAPSNALSADGVDDYVTLGDQPLLEFGDGTSDIKCGESATIEIDDLTGGFPISSKLTGSAPNNERSFQVLSNGKLEIKLFDSSTSVYIGQTGSTVLEVGRRYFVAWTYDGSGTSAGIKLYVGAVAESLTLTEAGSYTAMKATSAVAYLLRITANYGKGKVYSYVPWDRELSASDIALLAANGNQPEPADRWAGALAANETTWSGATGTTAPTGWGDDGTLNYNVATHDGQTTALNVTATTGSGERLYINSVNTAGKRHRIKFRMKVVSGSIRLKNLTEIVATITGSSWADYEYEWIGNGATISFEVTGASDDFWLDDFQINPIGAVASHQGRNLESDTSVDESSNEINGTINGAVRLFEPKAQSSGSFTPTLYFGASLQTLSSAAGYWWKDGVNDKRINFTMRLDSPAAVTDSGNVIIQGMPFLSVNDNTKQQSPEITGFSLTGLSGDLKAIVVSNSDDINIYQMISTGATPLTNSQMTTSTVLYITGSYEIA